MKIGRGLGWPPNLAADWSFRAASTAIRTAPYSMGMTLREM